VVGDDDDVTPAACNSVCQPGSGNNDSPIVFDMSSCQYARSAQCHMGKREGASLCWIYSAAPPTTLMGDRVWLGTHFVGFIDFKVATCRRMQQALARAWRGHSSHPREICFALFGLAPPSAIALSCSFLQTWRGWSSCLPCRNWCAIISITRCVPHVQQGRPV
jgi:hypothetical protein